MENGLSMYLFFILFFLIISCDQNRSIDENEKNIYISEINLDEELENIDPNNEDEKLEKEHKKNDEQVSISELNTKEYTTEKPNKISNSPVNKSLTQENLIPRWSYKDPNVGSYSSPKFKDLNKDGILDVVLGIGTEGSDDILDRYVIALDGLDGSEIWRVGSRNDMVNTAIFHDLNKDQVDDVLISGRDGEFIAINGSNGKLLWNLINRKNIKTLTGTWHNFYTPQVVPDQNEDGYDDILSAVTFFCDAIESNCNEKKTILVILDGLSGDIIYSDKTPEPDGSVEVYMPPILLPMKNNELNILYGTGGERHRGSLWRAPLSSIKNKTISDDSTSLFTGQEKGVMAPPSLADMNLDGINDIILATFEGDIIVIDGSTNKSHMEKRKFRI